MFQVSKRIYLMVLLLTVLGLVLAGCSVGSETPFVSPLTAFESPLSVSDGIIGTGTSSLEVPKPGKNTGVLIGRIYSTSQDSFLADYPVYLGEILPLDPGDDYLITLKEKESPKTMSSVDGYVVFDNVPPGEYALIVWLPFASSVVPDPSKPDKELLVNVVAGEVVNFGQVEVEFP